MREPHTTAGYRFGAGTSQPEELRMLSVGWALPLGCVERSKFLGKEGLATSAAFSREAGFDGTCHCPEHTCPCKSYFMLV